MSLRFHIDFPTRFELPSRCLRMRGWAFLPGSRLLKVRLFNGEYYLNGTYGTPRPDVAATEREAPDNETGFEIRGRLSGGSYEARLEFQDEHGGWHSASTFPLTAPRWVRPRWFPGVDRSELLAFQLAAHAAYPPRPIRPENFPASSSAADSTSRLALVTPSFQQCRHLGETIASVLNQRGVTVDYVVQDGGSSDGSADLIRSHSDRLKAWESAPDGGQADAISRGFEKLTGDADDLMAWINSDDFYLPGALAYVAGFFASHPEVDVIYGHRVLVDENSREIGRWFLPRHDHHVLRLCDFVPQETLFWRRRIWDKVGGLDRSLQFAMDWDLLLRFQRAGAKIVRVPRFLAAFRLHTGQKTAAKIHTVGQAEIDRLREKNFGRELSPPEIEHDPRLNSYLRKSALLEFLSHYGYRGSAG